MPRVGDFIKHVSNTDLVAEIIGLSDDMTTTRIRWWNVACGEPHIVGTRCGPVIEEFSNLNWEKWRPVRGFKPWP